MINHLLVIGMGFFAGYIVGKIIGKSKDELQAEANISEVKRIINDKIKIYEK